MKPIYKKNFDQIKAAYPAIFKTLEKGCKQLGIDFYLIGAQSREVWTNHLSLIKRTTNDIDYCVYVPAYTVKHV